ncbi:MAG TPA: T9SS type A sorting domain-containing protein [Bacteroidetes bacterium]|nr:T9SS type A sorting domain-containing protein [Bacteroidota bacterium]
MKTVTNHLQTLLLACLLTLAFGQTAQAAIIYVKSGASGTGTSWANAFGDLQAALAAANAGDQIWVATGTYTPTSGTDRTISFVMKNNLAIYGGFAGGETMLGQRDVAANVTTLSGEIGAAGNGDNSYHVISNDNNGLNSTAILDGFTISGGNGNGNTFPKNHAGGMFNHFSSPTVVNCSFSGNSAITFGGAVYNLFSSPPSPSLTNCSFSGNSAASGGAMTNYSSSPTVANCSFSGNSAGGYGGAIYNTSSSSPTVADCSFNGNSANSGGAMTNLASSPTVTNSSFSGNLAGDKGGGMYNFSSPSSISSPTVSNCSFSGNSANNGGSSGGGGGIHSQNSVLTITHSTFSTNTTAYAGGGLRCIGGSGSSTTVQYCTFSGNIANTAGGGGGGAIDTGGENLNVNNCTFKDNQDAGASNRNGLWLAGTTNIQNSIFDNGGGNIETIGGGFTSLGHNIEDGNSGFLDQSTDIINTEPLLGPLADNGGPTLTHALLPNSPAIDQGGTCGTTDQRGMPAPENGICDMGAFEYKSPCPAGNVLFVNKNAAGANNGFTWTDAFTDLQDALNSTCPGITEIWVAAGTYTPTSGTDRTISFVMKNNLAIYGGFAGGETMLGQRDVAANVTTLSGEIGAAGIADNSQTVVNGSGTDNTAILDGFIITAGNADGSTSFPDPASRGGGMYINAGTPTVANCLFNGNVGLLGGAMNNTDASPTITNCTFFNNRQTFAGFGGGGIMNERNSSPVISQSSFENNTAANGAGLWFSDSTNPTLTDCTFTNNQATGFGGAAFHVGSTNIAYLNCTFGNNSAVFGGAISTSGFAPATGNNSFVNCTFINNIAVGGGAINNGFINSTANVAMSFDKCYFKDNIAADGNTFGTGGAYQSQSFDASFTNCLLDGNKALGTGDDGGGGLMIYAGDVTLTNTTIANSVSATHGAAVSIFGNRGAVTVKNSILWNNNALSDNSIYNGNGGSANAENSLFQETACPPNVTCGTGMVFNKDPLFTNGFHLSECSPAIDGGTAMGAPFDDLDGNARPVDAAPNLAGDHDMGAYEFQGTAPAPTVACASNLTVQLGVNQNVTVTAAEVENGSTGCGSLSFLINNQASLTFDCNGVGLQTVTLKATDLFMNSASTTCSFTVEDGEAPTAICPASIPDVALDASGNALLPANIGDGSSTDNCSATETSPSMIFGCNSTGQQTVTLTADDGNGNTGTATCTFNVVDNIAPSANCPANIPDVALDANGNGTLPANIGDGSSTDNCGTPTETSPSANFNCADLGQQAVLLTATDGSGNFASVSCTFNVVDNTLPTAICPASIPDVVLDASGNALLPANIGDGSSTDNCSATETSPSMIFGCNSTGQQTVTLTADDGNGNTGTATCTFNVVDNIPPSANCPANISDVALDANGNGTLPANIGDGSSTDNCSATETSPSANFNCADLGQQTVVLTASDGSQASTANCTFNVVDNIPPSANCQDVVISLNSDGNYTLAPSEVFLNGTDNCGTVSPASVSPNSFSCQNEGANNVTLTADDGNGNIATCTATVTVNEFLSTPTVTATDETCAGAGDGSITLSATASAGQVGYSIDGGANFQFTGIFAPLSPGNYNVVVKVFGVAAICEKTATATVAAGNAPTTWYKDLDADGYTDGISQSSCTQPTGYVANALPGDCDDNDPNAYPGQVWHKDSDNDGYSDGSTQTACLRPADHKTAAELTATDIDCNDNDPAVNPGATEICNGIDDDCDGQVDEGTTGGLTYTGNVAFYTQADVDAFSQCYSVIDGSLIIAGTGINDLSNLANLTEVTGNLTVQTNGLTNLAGLDNLATIGGTLTIYFNSSLTSLNGLGALSSVGGSLMMYYNFLLDDCCAIHGLLNSGGVMGTVFIFYNKTGCNSVAEINANCGSSSLISSPNNGQGVGEVQVSVSQNESKSGPTFKVYPNPASENVSLQFDKKISSASVRITDLTGRQVFESTLEKGSSLFEINVADWQTGMYIIHVELRDKKLLTERLMVNGFR